MQCAGSMLEWVPNNVQAGLLLRRALAGFETLLGKDLGHGTVKKVSGIRPLAWRSVF